MASSAGPFVPDSVSLAKLRSASRECTGCDLYRHATQTVFGEGTRRATIVLVGEQPGADEDTRGRPFVGPAGRVLDAALEEAQCDPLSMPAGPVVRACLALMALLAAPVSGQPPSTDLLDLGRARDPGIVTLIRHTQTPGADDPAAFTPADCDTRRGLSGQGRQDARALGAALRAVGVREADVRAGQSCRCAETARLLGTGRVQSAAFLNAFVAGGADDVASTRALRAAVLQKLDYRRPAVFVTHRANITALTGLTAAEGEVVFVRATAAGTIDVVGRVRRP